MSESHARKCSHRTRSGRPCRAWAVHGTDPPACSAHARVPSDSLLPGISGFYTPVLEPEELADLVACSDDMTLDDEIACARIALRRILSVLVKPDIADTDPGLVARLAGLAFRGTRPVARLLRDQRALSGGAAEGLSGAIAQALDELGTEWGLEL